MTDETAAVSIARLEERQKAFEKSMDRRVGRLEIFWYGVLVALAAAVSRGVLQGVQVIP